MLNVCCILDDCYVGGALLWNMESVIMDTPQNELFFIQKHLSWSSRVNEVFMVAQRGHMIDDRA
jgi:hypothetical protein